MFLRRIRSLAAGLALVAIVWMPAQAQNTTATLLGTVGDPSGGSIAGVSVRAINLATNAVRETQTDPVGNYTLTNLAAGTYKITATKEGFQVQQYDNVTLQVEQSARLAVGCWED